MFETKGDRPQWQLIYDRIVRLNVGETIKDDELFTLLPDAAEGSVRGAFWRAVRELETERKRTFARVRSTGYRMVEAAEHERLARDQHKKAKRRLKSAWRKAHSADRSQLNQDQRQRLDAVEMNLVQQRDMINRLHGRVDKLDATLKAARREQRSDAAHLQERLDSLQDLLQRHGIAEIQNVQ